jgi:hypothetical protein
VLEEKRRGIMSASTILKLSNCFLASTKNISENMWLSDYNFVLATNCISRNFHGENKQEKL